MKNELQTVNTGAPNNVIIEDRKRMSISGVLDVESFDENEIKRIIKPNGTFVKIYMSYMLTDELANESHNLVKKLNKNWTPGASGAKDIYNQLCEYQIDLNTKIKNSVNDINDLGNKIYDLNQKIVKIEMAGIENGHIVLLSHLVDGGKERQEVLFCINILLAVSGE